jgi:hypothetical protein
LDICLDGKDDLLGLAAAGFVVEIRAAVDAAVRVFFGIRWK